MANEPTGKNEEFANGKHDYRDTSGINADAAAS
jgi:hypothetical protein